MEGAEQASNRLDALLELVGLARAELAQAQARAVVTVRRSDLDDAVYAARELGATWEQIGTAMGVSRARVHAKWGPKGYRRRIWETRKTWADAQAQPASAQAT